MHLKKSYLFVFSKTKCREAVGKTPQSSACAHHFGGSGFSVGPGGVFAGVAQRLVIVGISRELNPLGDVQVGLERVVHVVVQPAAHAVHRVLGTVAALADQIVPQAIARGRDERRRR